MSAHNSLPTSDNGVILPDDATGSAGTDTGGGMGMDGFLSMLSPAGRHTNVNVNAHSPSRSQTAAPSNNPNNPNNHHNNTPSQQTAGNSGSGMAATVRGGSETQTTRQQLESINDELSQIHNLLGPSHTSSSHSQLDTTSQTPGAMSLSEIADNPNAPSGRDGVLDSARSAITAPPDTYAHTTTQSQVQAAVRDSDHLFRKSIRQHAKRQVRLAQDTANAKIRVARALASQNTHRPTPSAAAQQLEYVLAQTSRPVNSLSEYVNRFSQSQGARRSHTRRSRSQKVRRKPSKRKRVRSSKKPDRPFIPPSRRPSDLHGDLRPAQSPQPYKGSYDKNRVHFSRRTRSTPSHQLSSHEKYALGQAGNGANMTGRLINPDRSSTLVVRNGTYSLDPSIRSSGTAAAHSTSHNHSETTSSTALIRSPPQPPVFGSQTRTHASNLPAEGTPAYNSHTLYAQPGGGGGARTPARRTDSGAQTSSWASQSPGQTGVTRRSSSNTALRVSSKSRGDIIREVRREFVEELTESMYDMHSEYRNDTQRMLNELRERLEQLKVDRLHQCREELQTQRDLALTGLKERMLGNRANALKLLRDQMEAETKSLVSETEIAMQAATTGKLRELRALLEQERTTTIAELKAKHERELSNQKHEITSTVEAETEQEKAMLTRSLQTTAARQIETLEAKLKQSRAEWLSTLRADAQKDLQDKVTALRLETEQYKTDKESTVKARMKEQWDTFQSDLKSRIETLLSKAELHAHAKLNAKMAAEEARKLSDFRRSKQLKLQELALRKTREYNSRLAAQLGQLHSTYRTEQRELIAKMETEAEAELKQKKERVLAVLREDAEAALHNLRHRIIETQRSELGALVSRLRQAKKSTLEKETAAFHARYQQWVRRMNRAHELDVKKAIQKLRVDQAAERHRLVNKLRRKLAHQKRQALERAEESERKRTARALVNSQPEELDVGTMPLYIVDETSLVLQPGAQHSDEKREEKEHKPQAISSPRSPIRISKATPSPVVNAKDIPDSAVGTLLKHVIQSSPGTPSVISSSPQRNVTVDSEVSHTASTHALIDNVLNTHVKQIDANPGSERVVNDLLNDIEAKSGTSDTAKLYTDAFARKVASLGSIGISSHSDTHPTVTPSPLAQDPAQYLKGLEGTDIYDELLEELGVSAED